MGFHQGFRQKNVLTKVKAKKAETTKQSPIPSQPVKATATQSSNPKYCFIYTPAGKICTNKSAIPITVDWPDSEEKKKVQKK